MKSAIFAAFALCTACVSQAATINIDVTRDLLTKPLGTDISLPSVVQIAAGDHVIHTVDFFGSQNLAISTSGYLLTYLFATNGLSAFTLNNVSLSLADYSGPGSGNYYLPTHTNGTAHIGPYVNINGPATFSGYRVEYDVQSITQSPNTYRADFLAFTGTSSVVIGNVPDHASSLVLLSLGVPVFALIHRRRRT